MLVSALVLMAGFAICTETADITDAETIMGKCGDGLTYTIDTDEKTLTIEGTGPMYDYLFQSSPWSYYKDEITTLVMKDGITAIGGGAFQQCSGFTGSLDIPSSVTSIGDSAFQHCSGFTDSLSIPSSVTSIGNSAFQQCSGFTGSLDIPSSVTSIGDYAFQNCSGFTDSLSIPSSVISIGNSAFQQSGFASIDVADNSPDYSSADGILYNKGQTELIQATVGNEKADFIIPSTVRSVGNGAFSGCSGFTGTLTIPSSVKTIGNGAFQYCPGFTGTLTVPSSVRSIGDYAFFHCTGIESLRIAETDKTIGKGAFGFGSSHKLVLCTVIGCPDGFLDRYGNDYTRFAYDKEHLVTYDVNGGSLPAESHAVREGDSFMLDYYTGKKKGCEFTGWQYDGDLYSPGCVMTMGKENMEFTAVWKEIVCHYVYYDCNGGKGNIQSQYIEEGETFTIPGTVPERSGYAFDSWKYCGERYGPGSAMVMGDSDIVLKAEWNERASTPVKVDDTMLYIIIAAVAVVALICVAVLVRRRLSE